MQRWMTRFLTLAFFFLHGVGTAHAADRPMADKNPFEGKPIAAPDIHVETLAQFAKWNDKPVRQGRYDPEFYARTRLGTVAFAPDLRVHIDFIQNLVHFPSYYELIDAKSGALLGKYEVFDVKDGVWYFTGNGVAYLHQRHLSLCGPRYTRKIVQKGKALAEVVEPLIHLDAESDVESPTQLYETQAGGKVVATVLPGTSVTVLGMKSGKSTFHKMAFLVKTPSGLTGWHLPRDKLDDGRISIYQCN
jgi:hypothetical protein